LPENAIAFLKKRKFFRSFLPFYREKPPPAAEKRKKFASFFHLSIDKACGA